MEKKKNELVPIPTRYKGCKFRSRLEARWAVFFDALGWKWIYEIDGFQLPSGWYLPDFYFPDLDIYAEVKPVPLNEKELQFCKELSLAKNVTTHEIDMILLVGQPGKNCYQTVSAGNVWINVVFVPIGTKYYPFFYTNDFFDTNFFEETEKAIIAAKEADFPYQQTNKL